jgi:hypothetical protein
MSCSASFTRRGAVAVLGFSALGAALPATAAERAVMQVHKDPSCGCCSGWVDHVRKAGYTVEVTESSALGGLKKRLAIPEALWSCHTAEVDGYVLEGHVPAAAVGRLLAERPRAKGLAVPGMPIGSPGMEVAGMEAETFDVVLFGPDGQSVFGRFKGGAQI